MTLSGDAERRRVFVPQALGADEFLRVTWHEHRNVIVFSHWEGDRCVAATPVRVADLGELAELTVAAFASALPPGTAPVAWAPPEADELVTTQLALDLSA